MSLENIFRQWWKDSYGTNPGFHAVMTHSAFAQHILDLNHETQSSVDSTDGIDATDSTCQTGNSNGL